MIYEILPSVCWSLIGFVVGWLVGREMLFITQIREAVVPEDERERTDHVVTPEKRSRLLGIIVVILAIFSVVQGSYYAYEAREKAECQAQFNADFGHVLTLRSKWADEDRAAEIKLWRDFLGAKPGEPREILSEYLDSVQRTEQLRRDNPIPKLEDRNC